MNKFSKKAAFGMTTAAAAAAVLAVGMAGPAMASTSHDAALKASSDHGSSSVEATLTLPQWDALHTMSTGLTGGNLSAGDLSAPDISPTAIKPEVQKAVAKAKSVTGTTVPTSSSASSTSATASNIVTTVLSGLGLDR